MTEQPTQPVQPPPIARPASLTGQGTFVSETSRTFIFLAMQVGFLLVSPITGGFHNKMWSMLDSAILITSIGITGLLFVVEGAQARRIIFRIAILLYICAVIDMSVNVMLTGHFGWESLSGLPNR